jgi:hypothetical protein
LRVEKKIGQNAALGMLLGAGVQQCALCGIQGRCPVGLGGTTMPINDLRKILITDSDEDVLVALERLLEDGGYATETAISYEEASRRLAQGTFR